MTETEPRTYALAAAQHLANALDALNRTGWTALDHQRDGAAYGEAHDALRITVAALWPPAFTDQIIDRYSSDGVSIVTAARTVAEDLYHAAGERQSDTWDDWQAIDAETEPDASTAAHGHYMTALALVDNATTWMQQTHADCCRPTPLPTY